ncbi:unnamed protein product [Candida verbasci]|uniref:DNL-type domain-containing protein n=1 Tax=Candida verbasci TaxID=1227364 RepID=A0A9W4XC31_9ASCO|nr:unnamed protein product [Candida verbasci]
MFKRALYTQLRSSSRLITASLLRPVPRAVSCNVITIKRFQSIGRINPNEGELMIQFTCNICDKRSSHTMSKQAYQYGTVLVQCPSCKSRHLIADNLGFIDREKFNLQDYLKEKGESIETNPNSTVLEFKSIPDNLKQTVEDMRKGTPTEEMKLPPPKDKNK